MAVHREFAKQDGKRIQVPLTYAARTVEAVGGVDGNSANMRRDCCRSVLKSGLERTWGFMPPRPGSAMILRATTGCICPVRR
jgi:hypothetical protein